MNESVSVSRMLLLQKDMDMPMLLSTFLNHSLFEAFLYHKQRSKAKDTQCCMFLGLSSILCTFQNKQEDLIFSFYLTLTFPPIFVLLMHLASVSLRCSVEIIHLGLGAAKYSTVPQRQ